MEFNLFQILGKILMTTGALLILIGLILSFGDKVPYFGRLPGDIVIKKENFIFYFPFTSFLILSLFFSFLVWIFFKIFQK